MRVAKWVSLAFFLFFFNFSQAQQASPVLPITTAEQNTIYALFLDSYLKDRDRSVLNIAEKTDTLAIEEMDRGKGGCAHDVTDAEIADANITMHRLDPTLTQKRKIRLVDPATHKLRDPGVAIGHGESVDDAVEAGFDAGLFTFSEIAFNKAHNQAAFSYWFHCGSLCGHGGLIIYELKNSSWQRSKRFCSVVMS